jgi:hypothetical protein
MQKNGIKELNLVHVDWVALKATIEQMPQIWDYGPKGN